jgi:UDP-GlcNAc:undecaprenyl-phosphate GlcNAc-1-phosphate transferase
MGDTGSQFLGVLLSLISILYLWNYRLPAVGQTHDLLMISRNIVLVALAFTMTLADTTVVVINRLIKGKSPFVGGKDHTTHHLALLGLSDRQVAMVFIFFSMISISLVLIIAHIGNAWSWLYTLAFGSYFLAIVAVFFTMTHLSSKRLLSTDKIQETI